MSPCTGIEINQRGAVQRSQPPKPPTVQQSSGGAASEADAAPGGAEAVLATVLEAMTTGNRRTLAMMNSNYKEVLRAMRGELAKETKRLETVFAANDARVLQIINAQAGRIQVRPRASRPAKLRSSRSGRTA